jgi:polar amino acid transport system substrate-binding protein
LFVTCQKVLEEAYRRIGIHMKLVAMPGERSLISANSGETDGDLCQMKGGLKTYRNLVEVPHPLAQAEIVAFSTRQLNIRTWKDLRPYLIDYERGVKVVEQNTVGMKAIPTNSMEVGFRKMLAGHADVHIDAKTSGLFMLNRIGYRHIYISAPLNIHSMQHHLYIKHRELVDKLNAALEQMQQDGSIARIDHSVNSPWQCAPSERDSSRTSVTLPSCSVPFTSAQKPRLAHRQW